MKFVKILFVEIMNELLYFNFISEEIELCIGKLARFSLSDTSNLVKSVQWVKCCVIHKTSYYNSMYTSPPHPKPHPIQHQA